MRLIDADALNIRSYCRWFDDPDDIRVVERMIREAPAITPPLNAPVIHGRWVDNGIPDSMLSGCSVCGFRCGAFSFRYCPICGAKMDGEDSKTDTRRGMKQPSSQPPNDPLSLEELREMDGEPVWVVQPHEVLPPFWGIVDADDESVANGKYCANFEDYDTEWLAYRRKPEEGTV